MLILNDFILCFVNSFPAVYPEFTKKTKVLQKNTKIVTTPNAPLQVAKKGFLPCCVPEQCAP